MKCPFEKITNFSHYFHCRIIQWLSETHSTTIFFYTKNWVGIVLGTVADSMLPKWIWRNFVPWFSRELRNVPNFTRFVLWFLLLMRCYLLGIFSSMVFPLSSIRFPSWLASEFWFLITPIFYLCFFLGMFGLWIDLFEFIYLYKHLWVSLWGLYSMSLTCF